MYETAMNTQGAAVSATQIVVLNVLGSSPSGHPKFGKVSKIANCQCLSVLREIPP